MPFTQYDSTFKPQIGRPISLSRNNMDLATLALTFHYQEWVDTGEQWNWEPREQILEPHKHQFVRADYVQTRQMVHTLKHRRRRARQVPCVGAVQPAGFFEHDPVAEHFVRTGTKPGQ